jgi:ketosteroid isomerase-like protein
MTSRAIAACIGLGLGSAILVGQSSKVDLKADEAAIRALIARGGNPPHTTDIVMWTGVLKRPRMGSEPAQMYPDAGVERRTNQKTSYRVQRLEVAASGDMAWEFSYGTLEYDKDSRHVSFDTGGLRVWKKVDGKWSVAANFMRPLDQPFVPMESVK